MLHKSCLQMRITQKNGDVLKGWLNDKIIEDVPECEMPFCGHFLPHWSVIKENSTTPIRSVFDTSARIQNHPFLKQYLYYYHNLIQLIPGILLRYREDKFGVVADIKKAFFRVNICKEDRDFWDYSLGEI